MRSYYQMAGYNVHATAKGLYFRLGNLSNIIIAGRTNAGLTEPAQNTAYTLCTIHSLLTDSKHYDTSKIIAMRAVIMLRNEIPGIFWRAEKKLARDERKYQRQEAEKAVKRTHRRQPKKRGKR